MTASLKRILLQLNRGISFSPHPKKSYVRPTCTTNVVLQSKNCSNASVVVTLLCIFSSTATTIKNADEKPQEEVLEELSDVYEQNLALQRARAEIDEKLSQLKRRQKKLESTVKELKSRASSSPPLLSGRQTATIVGERITLGSKSYVVEGRVGRGAYGTILVAHNVQNSNDQIAFKRSLLSDTRGTSELQHEISVLQYIASEGGHENILTLIGVCKSHSAFLTMGMNFMPGGDLFDVIRKQHKKMNEETVMKILRQVASALVFMHSRNMTHGDLKPENVLTRKNSENDDDVLIKLADFGSASVPTTSITRPTCDARTTAYCPPELLLGGTYDLPSDMWAVGCILFVMLFGRHPFDLTGRSTKGQIEANIVTTDVEQILARCCAKKNISKEAKLLVTSLLARNVEERMTAEELLLRL